MSSTENREEFDNYPTLIPLLSLEDAFLDGAEGDAAENFLCALYAELEDGELKPSYIHRQFKETLGSMSNHPDAHVVFMATDLLREIPLRSSLPWTDLNQKYWENGYTGKLEELAMLVDEKQPAIVEGWNSYVIECQPFNDPALNEDFIFANLNGEGFIEDEPLLEDRGFEPEHFMPDITLTNDWIAPITELRLSYYERLQTLRDVLKQSNVYLSNEWVIKGEHDGATTDLFANFIDDCFIEVMHFFDELVANAHPLNELVQVLYSLETINMPLALQGFRPLQRGTQALVKTSTLDHSTPMLLFHYKNHPAMETRLEHFILVFEDEVLEKLTSDGSLHYSAPTYERIAEMADIALGQILSTFPDIGDARESRIWNEGYIRAVIEDGIPDAHSKAWEYYRYSLSSVGAIAFDTAEDISESWKLFNIVSRAAGDVKDIVISFEDDGVIIAPEYNPAYHKKISWGLALHKLRKNEFAPTSSAFGQSNEIAQALAMMLPSLATVSTP